MAEDLRNSDSSARLAEEPTSAIVAECRRQEESCLYTSTTFYIWLRQARVLRRFFIATPIALGALATWSVLDQPDSQLLKWITATTALLAGLIPSLYEALKLNVHIDGISQQAAEFKNLQDRFRQAANITSRAPLDDLRGEFDVLMGRMEAARAASFTPPERFFAAARKKILRGDYEFSTDNEDNRLPRTQSSETDPREHLT